MNRVLWLLMTVLLLGVSADALALPGFRPLSRASIEQESYTRSRAMALGLVQAAAPRLDRRDARLAAPVLAALSRARFLASSDERSRLTCSSRQFSLFVNARHRDTIFVCDEVRDHARHPGTETLATIAQGFVHEAVHLTGQMDECEASRFELAVMGATIGIRSHGSQIRYGRACRGRW